ncbi:DNA-directed RNA polymerase sigma-70 factor [Thermaurantimonas aggregans]|uniref:DNA-directed RNA polymerase sigma-70 factor n=1 Tax=Thermaurantimonas aggregans TaxID=2173829 RepID=A0A401XM57_9FLAO|nr:sigma-70 family RNA polymerase sigma factor [Thermaurantimonas aggregans]MCX8147966.1 sigma-70 family RNA polymerase sigma factor [Thermaurantimonas aggregans]GCD78097.1 DNA-directed RNA polymerase sigma-70 factor [Thermaurantimonas aggregans]
MKISEDELIEALKKGKVEAQERFYQRFAPKILAVCYRYLTDEDEAEDMMIQSLLRALQNIASYKAVGTLEGWVKRIAVNECLKQLRKKSAFQMVPLHEVEEEDNDFAFEDADITYLLDLIRSLPEGYRTVFNLYVIEGYSHSEIAGMLGISMGTSKSQLSRARAILKEKLMKTHQINRSNEREY